MSITFFVGPFAHDLDYPFFLSGILGFLRDKYILGGLSCVEEASSYLSLNACFFVILSGAGSAVGKGVRSDSTNKNLVETVGEH